MTRPLTQALSDEWASHGVEVNAIAPGYMRTDNTATLQADPTRYPKIAIGFSSNPGNTLSLSAAPNPAPCRASTGASTFR